MGLNISGILAILFMDMLEMRAISNFHQSVFYRRYVDDIFALVKNSTDAIKLHEFLNTQHSAIKFEIKHPSGGEPGGFSLNLLDISVKISSDGEVNFHFFKKPARRNIFVHYDAALPRSSKISIARNERSRIITRCSTIQGQRQENSRFDHTLRLHNYPQEVINKTYHGLSAPKQYDNPQQGSANNSISRPPTFRMKMPFISDKVNGTIRRIFAREGINVQIVHASYSIRNALARRPPQATCNKRNCPLSDPTMCTKQSVVYIMTCKVCNQFYIGSTIRNLHTRVDEHYKSPQSSVHRHMQYCVSTNTPQFKTGVIAQVRDPLNLRIREGIEIASRRPTINSREEFEDMASFIIIYPPPVLPYAS